MLVGLSAFAHVEPLAGTALPFSLVNFESYFITSFRFYLLDPSLTLLFSLFPVALQAGLGSYLF